jgi:hypothetical protein
MSWFEMKQAAPELAAFGESRLGTGVAYLATIKKDGSPRVHPVTPIIGGDRLFLFMEPTSPKGHDLRRDGRYALHSSVQDSSGEGGEFLITGIAQTMEDDETRAVAAGAASYEPADRYVLFELEVDTAFTTYYDEEGEPVRQRWTRS